MWVLGLESCEESNGLESNEAKLDVCCWVRIESIDKLFQLMRFVDKVRKKNLSSAEVGWAYAGDVDYLRSNLIGGLEFALLNHNNQI